jgi:integrase
MPRLIYRLPKYALHKPSGQARVKYNGKVIYLGAYGSTESHEAYARFVAKLPKPGESVPPVAQPPPGVTPLVGEVVLLYLAHAERYYARDGIPTGEHVTIRCTLGPLVDLFADLPISEFGPKKLKQVQQAMVNLSWSRRYINKATGIIKRCFSWCASEEVIPADVALALKTVGGLKKGRTSAREKPTVSAVADETVEATLPHLSELTADIIRVMRLTGARPGEVLGMEAAGIDRSDPTCWIYRPSNHKTAHHDKARTILIGPRAQEIVLPRIMKAGTNGKLFPMRRTTLWTLVHRGCRRAFPHPTLSETPAGKLTEKQLAELKEWDKAHAWHPNQLRHSAATQFRREHGLEAAQVLLGHSRADVTQVYAERDLRKAQEVVRRIG